MALAVVRSSGASTSLARMGFRNTNQPFDVSALLFDKLFHCLKVADGPRSAIPLASDNLGRLGECGRTELIT